MTKRTTFKTFEQDMIYKEILCNVLNHKWFSEADGAHCHTLGPGIPGKPPIPGSPVSPGIPFCPGNPSTPGKPLVPFASLGSPGCPSSPSVPGTPGRPFVPGQRQVDRKPIGVYLKEIILFYYHWGGGGGVYIVKKLDFHVLKNYLEV